MTVLRRAYYTSIIRYRSTKLILLTTTLSVGTRIAEASRRSKRVAQLKPTRKLWNQ